MIWRLAARERVRDPLPMPTFTTSFEGTQRSAVSTSGDREPASLTLSFRSRIARPADRALVSARDTKARTGKGLLDGRLEELWTRDARGSVDTAARA